MDQSAISSPATRAQRPDSNKKTREMKDRYLKRLVEKKKAGGAKQIDNASPFIWPTHPTPLNLFSGTLQNTHLKDRVSFNPIPIIPRVPDAKEGGVVLEPSLRTHILQDKSVTLKCCICGTPTLASDQNPIYVHYTLVNWLPCCSSCKKSLLDEKPEIWKVN